MTVKQENTRSTIGAQKRFVKNVVDTPACAEQTSNYHSTKTKKQNLSLNLQIKSFWEAKIKHVISKAGQKQNSFGEKKDDEHMFTFPFTTVDNSLHSCCTDLKEFYNHAKDNDVPDSVYGQNHFAPCIIIDETSIRSARPGCKMDNDMIDFRLSW